MKNLQSDGHTDILRNGKLCGYHHYFSILTWLKNSQVRENMPHKKTDFMWLTE